MKRKGTSWHCAVAIALVPVAIAGTAWACDLVPPPQIMRGILGSAFEVDGAASDLVLPRNFAVVDRGGPLPTLDDGTPLVLQPAELRGLARVATNVEPGSTITSDAAEVARVEDVVDTTAPSEVTLVGGAFEVSESDGDGPFSCQNVSSCGTIVRLSVDLDPASDDHTPADRMTYALFLGASMSEAAAAAVPDGFFVRDGIAIWRFGDEADGNHDIWVVVAAVDLAGNVGPRSAPMQIHSSSSGCRVAPGGSVWSTAFVAIAILLALMWRARRSTRAS